MIHDVCAGDKSPAYPETEFFPNLFSPGESAPSCPINPYVFRDFDDGRMSRASAIRSHGSASGGPRTLKSGPIQSMIAATPRRAAHLRRFGSTPEAAAKKNLQLVPVFFFGLRLEGKGDQKRPTGPLLRSPLHTEKEIEMKTSMFRMCTILAIGLAASLQTLQAEQRTPEGVWDVSVTVTDCDTGALIRTVRSLQAFHPDGSITETANTASRGISEGVFRAAGRQVYDASYWFFQYNTTGTFLSFAKVSDKIDLGSDGHFTSKGTVLDFDANGNLISTGCFVHTADRLTEPEH
jgi:hypothetical protein